MNRNVDDTIWKERAKQSRKILGELLDGEFKGKLKKLVFLSLADIWLKEPGTMIDAQIYTHFFKFIALINVNKACWGKHGFGEQELRNILRHELLHLELMADDDDPEFRKESQRRGLKINTPEKNVCSLCSDCAFSCKKYEYEAIKKCRLFTYKRN